MSAAATLATGFLATGLLAMSLMGCDITSGADPIAGPGPTTTAATPGEDATSGEPTAPEDVTEELAGMAREITHAAGDFCATVRAATQPLDVTPRTEEEAAAAADLLVTTIEHLGAVAGDDAGVYEAAAEAFAEDADHDGPTPEWLLSAEALVAFDDPAFVQASARLHDRYRQECGGG